MTTVQKFFAATLFSFLFLSFVFGKNAYAQTYTCEWSDSNGVCQVLDASDCNNHGCTAGSCPFNQIGCGYAGPQPCICGGGGTYTCTWDDDAGVCTVLDGSDCVSHGCVAGSCPFNQIGCGYAGPQPCVCTRVNFGALYSAMGLNFNQATSIGNIISVLLNYIFPIAGLVFLLIMIASGIKMMTSAGDPKKVASAKDGLTSGIIGFVIIFVSYWLVQLIASILGIPDIVTIFT